MLYYSRKFIVLFLFVTVYNICVSDGYHMIDQYSYSVLNNRTKRQAVTCKSYEFRCAAGNQCIDQGSLCDGIVDCNDRSDETTDCRKISCPDFAFQCAYGACVDGAAECNNEQQCADGSDENTARCPKIVINNACGKLKFTCENGECISNDKMCDGAEDCTDGSDEKFTTCSSIPCPDYAFACAYGGCVSGDAKCNNIKDCADESDERPDVCGKPFIVTEKPLLTTTSRPGIKGCIVPNYPKNGYYNISGNVKRNPGAELPTGSYLVYACNAGYAMYPTALSKVFVILCGNNKWSAAFPSCIRTCPPRISDSVDITCEFNGQLTDCEKPMLEGTFAKMKCKNHHKNLDLTFRNPTTKCEDGSWDDTILRCVPDCGNLIPKSAQLYVVGGKDAAIGDFPWHVGVYKPVIKDTIKEIFHICGGSIITNRIVISAAHCFTEQASGKKLPEENYLIAAGKFYRDYDDERDSSAQKTEVEKIVIPKEYRGLQLSYTYDIALVVVKTPFSISNLVQPICIDWANEFEDEQLKDDSFGLVAGWGLTKEGAKIGATSLKELKVPFIDRETCEVTVPFDFKQFITPDKFCAGFTNGSSVCQGDSGGGLVFEKAAEKKYFIRGLVSNGPIKDNSCNSYEYGVYTKLSKHVDWVAKVEKDYKST